MSVPLMVGVCGGAWGDSGVGKTTVVNILVKSMGFYPVSFVDPVKDIARKFFEWDGKMDKEARILLDRICRMGRGISEDYWRDLTVARIPKDEAGDRIVFDDVWFPNEVKMIASSGGIVLRVIKQGFESPVLPCETIDIDNDGSMIDLQRMAVLAVTDAIASR